MSVETSSSGPGILVVDFGSQTAHLIGRRLRQLGIRSEYCNPDAAADVVRTLKPKGIILSGGPSSVYDDNSPVVDPAIYNAKTPILGICYGWQLMANQLGGEVQSTHKEYGPEKLHIKPGSNGLFTGMPSEAFSVIMSHGDTVTKLPEGFSASASSDKVVYAATQNLQRKLYGVQFHPEAHHTEYGTKLLQNFAENICKLESSSLLLDPEKVISGIREKVGDKKVICAVSGGVDSTVAAFLIGKAIGTNLIPVYVDSGLMRPETEKLVSYIFSDLIKTDLVVLKTRDKFLSALKGITDPEQKRKTIGRLYIELFDEVAKEHHADFLAQGTIYSDVIESKGSKHSSQIKSHHNVGGLPEGMKLKLLEPLRSFYKDEVRELGRLSGLPEEIVMQQPFPGPGYAVRIRGEVTEQRLEQVIAADKIVVEEMKSANLYDKVFQCFAIMSGAYSTAVKGDARAFSEVVAIRAYSSEDVMTSEWAYLPKDVLARMSSRIVNEVPDVSRVVFDITTKPPATMEWE